MIIVTRGQPHLLLSNPSAEAVPWKRILSRLDIENWRPGMRIKPSVLRIGREEAPCAKLISGVFEFTDRRRNLLMEALPDYLILRSNSGASFEDERTWPIVRLIDREIQSAAPGAGMMAARLADYLFVQAVREYLVDQQSNGAGWLRGLRDPTIGKALALIHSEAGTAWTVERLAHAAGASRSSFARRFKDCVGIGPIEYLTDWRMFEAAGMLADDFHSLKEIAKLAGYNSTAAFGKAFKRWSGETPALHRSVSHGKERPKG